MNNINMKIMILSMVQTNCYIIDCKETKEAIVIDPGDEAEKIKQYLNSKDLVCKGILLTHGHFDHIMAAQVLADDMNASIYAHEDEVELLKDPIMNSSARIQRECSLAPTVILKDQEMLVLAGMNIKVIHTPGHTAGGVCYYFKENEMLISGDTLFREDIGRTDLPTGNGKKLVESIRTKLMMLEDQVKVYPGHGISTTIGHEREHNIYVKQNGENMFF